MNTRFAVATHLLAFLALNQERPVSSQAIAHSLGTHPVVVRRLVGTLSSAGLVRTQLGAGGGALLTKAPQHVSLLDVFDAMQEPDLFALNNTSPNLNCGVGGAIQLTLEHLCGGAEQAMRQALAGISIMQVMEHVKTQMPGHQCTHTAG